MDRPLVAVVLAGGVGSRLYPASRSHRPKQFLALDGEDSLLTRTVERAAFADRVLVVTREAYAEQAREHADAADLDGPADHAPPVEVVAEPAGRDTGPALLYATYEVRRRDAEADPEPVVLALPSDHHVAGDYALGGEVGEHYREVEAFHEKPDAETAEAYVEAGHLWNAGMFAWTPSALFREARDSPLAPLVAALDGDDPERGFERVDPVSIDFAVMERADDVVVVPADVEWDDLGSWDALARFFEADDAGNVALGEALTVDAADNVVASDDKHVSLVGVEGLAVVAWDDRVLVVPKAQAQRVRDAVADLRADDAF